MGFLDDYALIGNEATEKILLTPSVGVMPRFSPTGGNDAPTPVRELGLQPYGALKLFFRRPEGVQGASGKPRARIGMRQFCHENFPCGGLTRRLRRGAGLASLWGAHTFLSMAKEKCAKESQRHGTTGKRLLLPILTAGLAMSRAMELDSFHKLLERARARLFPPSKWAGLFPSAAYRRSAPPQVALGRLKWRCLGRFCVAWIFLLHKRPA